MTRAFTIQPAKRSTQEHPLSWFQERLWLLNQKNPQDVSYNIPVTFLIEGILDSTALNRSLTRILSRHQNLRTRFISTPRGEPAQIIAPEAEFLLPEIQVREDELAQHVSANANHVFNLSDGPILIGRLLHVNPRRHLLLLNVHHIAADGWSIEGILFSELQECYAAFCADGEPRLPLLAIQYTDFAYWQRRQELSLELTFWQDRLANYESSLELPSDFLRTPQSGRRSNTLVRRYSKEFSVALDQFAQGHGCTLFMCLLAGFALTVSRYTGREDLCIGTTTSGRNLPELEGLIGFFINILPLRIRVDEGSTVEDYMNLVRETALSGFDHQMVPFERILYSMERVQSESSNALVPLVLRHQNFPHARMDGTLPGGVRFLAYTDDESDDAISNRDTPARCELELSYTGDRNELKVEVMYASDLYRRQTIDRLLSHHEHLLKSMFAGPRQRLNDLAMLSPDSVRRLCGESNQSAQRESPLVTFVERWNAQARSSPTAIACYDELGPWRYDDIAAKVNQLTQTLATHGIRDGDVVGVCLDRGAPLLVSLLSIWKSGAAYVPLDPSYPVTYLQQILTDAAPKRVICSAAYQAKLGLAASDCCVLDSQLDRLSERADPSTTVEVTPDHLAYIMYTSGSTGTPKGVLVPHRQLINWLGGLEANWPFVPGDVVAQKTTMAFAVSVKELFAGLLNGCPIVFLDSGTVQHMTAFVAALARHEVTRLNLVPSHLEALLAHLRKEGMTLPAMRICVTAGEPLTAEIVQEFRTILPGARLVNNYGCTELNDITYFDTTLYDDTQGFVPIGRPIQNTRLYVLDRRGRLVPEGVPGELHVATDGMSKGYHNLSALTAERFLRNPFDEDPNSILYNTGDVVKCLSDGQLEYIGRWDFQVKVRGFRVDVRHVEKALGEYEGMGIRAVVGDGAQLMAFYMAQPERTIDVGALREFLQLRLPAYMIPSTFIAMDTMPRLPNGKLDRRALKPSAGRMQRSEVYEAPSTPTETLLAAIWSEVLEIPEEAIGRRTHFFEIGGHSLSATRLIARMKDQLGLEIGLSQVFEYPRLEELGQYVCDSQKVRQVEDDLRLPKRSESISPFERRGVPGLLENKVVLVTGGSRGIGSTTVRLLASQGASVAINYVQSHGRATQAKELIEHAGGIAEVFRADITDVDQVAQMVSQVRSRFGKIDVLVANAAIGFKIQPFLEYDWADFERKLNDELRSMFYLCQAIIPEMVERKTGSIVAVSSSMSKLAQDGYVAHSTAKAALDAFVRALAVELGPEGVRINTVAPGLTLTDATANMPHQQKDAAAARCPLRRNGLPRDVAGAVLFLASDLSQFMTGAYLPVDGGFTML